MQIKTLGSLEKIREGPETGNTNIYIFFLPYINGFLKARMLTYVVLCGVRNWRIQGKPPTLSHAYTITLIIMFIKMP